MRKSLSTTLLAATVSLSTLAAVTQAQAGAFALREQSTTGVGMAFAGAASGAAGLSSMFWNPATITMRPGWNSEWNLSLIVPESRYRGVSTFPPGLAALGPSGDIGQDAVLPSSYTSYQLNDRLFIGLSTNTPFGLTTKPNNVWAGQTYARSTQVKSIEVAPTVGYIVNDWLSIGVGLRIMYLNVRYNSALSASPLAPTGGLHGDGTSVGYSVGATITPFAGTQIGIGFRSAVEQKLEGEFSYALPIKLDLMLPESLNVGITQRITDRLSLSAGAEWTNWSRLGFPRVINGITGNLFGPVPAIPLDYKDGWYYSVGAEYRVDPAWTVRAGVGYEVSPIDTRVRSFRLPDNDRVWLSLGGSYQWNDKLTFDVGYTHIFMAGSTRVNMGPGNPAYNGLVQISAEAKSRVDIVSLGVKYRWDNPAVPAPVLVRKN